MTTLIIMMITFILTGAEDWEKKYYELHPDQLKQDQEKAHPEKRRHTDEDDVEWHRL